MYVCISIRNKNHGLKNLTIYLSFDLFSIYPSETKIIAIKSIYLSIFLFSCLSIHPKQKIRQKKYRSIYLSFTLYFLAYLFIRNKKSDRKNLSIYLSFSLFSCLSIHSKQKIRLRKNIYVFIYLSLYFLAYLSIRNKKKETKRNENKNIVFFPTGVTHADDLMYLFSLPADLDTEEQLRVKDYMVTLWTNFAIHG